MLVLCFAEIRTRRLVAFFNRDHGGARWCTTVLFLRDPHAYALHALEFLVITAFGVCGREWAQKKQKSTETCVNGYRMDSQTYTLLSGGEMETSLEEQFCDFDPVFKQR